MRSSEQTNRSGSAGALLALRYETFPLHSSGTLQGLGIIAPGEKSKREKKRERGDSAGRKRAPSRSAETTDLN
jgi:hypothetical protein